MATPRWIGGAPAVSQVDTLTIGGTIEVGDLFLNTFGTKILSYAATSVTAATDATGFAAAWNALSSTYYPEFASITAAATSGGALTLTADTAGVGFTVSISTTEANGSAADDQTFIRAASVANDGPNVWSAKNFSGNALPTASDTLYIDNDSDDILYSLAQAGSTVTAGIIAQSFQGTIGLPKENIPTSVNGTTVSYPEYRTDYLQLDCSLWTIGQGQGRGSGRIKIDAGSVQTSFNIYGSGTRKETNVPACLLKGSHASNAMVCGGNADVGVAFFGGETATILTLKVESNARVIIGAGTALGTVTVNGGKVEINCAIATLITVNGGTVTINGTGAVAGLVVNGGRVNYNTTGTLGGAPIVYSGILSFDGDPRAKTVTNPIDVFSLPGVIDSDKVVASLIVDYNGLEPVRGLGKNVRVTRGTPA